MTTFDPSEYVRGLQQLLVSDKKRIGFLCGAGTSLARKDDKTKTIPAIQEMTKQVVICLRANEKYSIALDEIIKEIGVEKFNIESFLSNIETKLSIIGDGSLNSLNRVEFEQLVTDTKKCVSDIVSIHKELVKEDMEHIVHTDFAQWIGRADRKYPIEIFTTNYDYLFELGLENNNVAYYDGFSGSFCPFFCSETIENLSFLPQQPKLWKIHGSLGWTIDDNKRVIRGPSNKDNLLIYPSILKYANSKKQPYTALMDRLTNFLKQPDSVLFVCGYSFSDEHINDRIISALQTDTTAHVYVLLYDKVWQEGKKSYLLSPNSPTTVFAQRNGKLSILGCRYAVIGCQYGEWMLKREPSKQETIDVNYFFDEDAYENSNDPMHSEQRGSEIWAGKGEFVLPDFGKFVSFLKSMIVENGTNEAK